MARNSSRGGTASALRGVLMILCIGLVMFLSLLSERWARGGGGVPSASPAKRFLEEEEVDGEMTAAAEASEDHGHSHHEGSAQREGLGHEHEEGGDEEEEEFDPMLYSTVVMGIVLLLILLTIGFEKAEHRMQHSADENMAPIIESLFGEMTILGFLSVFTFVLSKTGAMMALSVLIFDEHEALLEIFEFVHYTLFFIMIFFVLQVVILVKQGTETEAEWLEMERACREPKYMKAVSKSIRSHLHWLDSFWDLLPMVRDVKAELREDQLMFDGLRREFLLERRVDPPFRPLEASKRVNEDFNFGAYLSKCVGKMLADVVELQVVTWAIFAVFTVVFYAINIVFDNNMVILGWVWVAVGWAMCSFNIIFEKRLINIRHAFVGFSDVRERKSFLAFCATEASGLLPTVQHEKMLPEWCKVDMKKYMANRPWFVEKLVGKRQPNRQHTLFWFERKGPKVHMLILQINLVFTGVYSTMLLLAFLGTIWRETDVFIFALYVVLATLPVLAIMLSKKHLVATMTQVGSIGSLRKPHVIADVIREEKTARAVRTFIVLYKMYRAAEKRSKPVRSGLQYSRSFDSLEIADMGKTFEVFDQSSDGYINTDDLKGLMEMLGQPLETDQVMDMIAMFDTDGDGKVSKDEFLQWYADTMGEDDLSLKEKAHFLFKIFDKDGNGEITISELKDVLDAFNMGFSFDEIGDIVKALDKDGNGTIGEDEFEDLLEKYYPKELHSQPVSGGNVELTGSSTNSHRLPLSAEEGHN